MTKLQSTPLPTNDSSLRGSEWLKNLKRALGDCDYYGNPLPLSWRDQNKIIARLITEVEKPESGHGEGI